MAAPLRFVPDADIDAVDLDGFLRVDEDVLDPVDDPGLDEVTPGGVDLDRDIRRLQSKVPVVDKVFRAW